MAYILTNNLRNALEWAIALKGIEERIQHGPTFESGLVDGWKEVLQAIQRGEPIQVLDEPPVVNVRSRGLADDE